MWRSIQSILAFDNRFELLLQRLFFRHSHLQVHRFRNCEMIVDHRYADAGSIRGCLTESAGYRGLLRHVRLSKDAIVLDIGANVGGFAMLVAGTFGKNAIRRFVSVEMNPMTYERLRFNMKSNFGDSAEIIWAAVCSQQRDVRVSLGDGSTSDNIYSGSSSATGAVERSIQGR